MADALAKYRAALKRYRRENPNVPFRTAQKRVAAEMKSGKVSGPKKRKTLGSAPRKTAIGSRKKRVSVTERVTATKTVGRVRKYSGKHKLPAKSGGFISKKIETGRILIKNIDKLEAQYKRATNKYEKHLLAHEINGLHDKLDALTKPKRKSA